LAKQFEQLIGSDDRFEVPAERHLGMVVFRLKGENEMTERLLKRLNGSGIQNLFRQLLTKKKQLT
jgi:histidine decarboxylase